MKDLSTVPYHPMSEQIVDILCQKTQNDSSGFFRLQTAYNLSKCAAMLHVKVNSPILGIIPTNMYAINLAPSGMGKGYCTNILEDSVINNFRTVFEDQTYPVIIEENLAKYAVHQANIKGGDPDEELAAITAEFNILGSIPFAFDSGSTPAVKQAHYQILVGKVGSLNFEMDECYTPDMEVLTEKGFCRFDELPHNVRVAQFDTNTERINFVEPSRYIEKEYSGLVYDLVTPSGFDMTVTENHEVLALRKGKYFKCKPSELNTGHTIPLTGKTSYKGVNSISTETALAIAIQADATVRPYGVEFGFKKDRKIVRLISLLEKLNIEYSLHTRENGYTHFYISEKQLTDVIVTKHLTDLISNIECVSAEYCKSFINECVQWDGSINKELTNIIRYTNTCKASVELVHTLAVLAGYNAKMHLNGKAGYGECYYVSINLLGSSHASLAYLDNASGNQPPIRQSRQYTGKVYCVTVPTGNIVLRRNGKAFIGGNCGSNLTANMDMLATMLELFDVGKTKQKMIKNTKDNKRGRDIKGSAPANMLLFGTPTKVFDGGKTEEEYMSFQSIGGARRCFVSYTRRAKKRHFATVEEAYTVLTDKSKNQSLVDISAHLGQLANPVNYNKIISIPKASSLLLLEYKQDCERKAELLGETPKYEMIKAETSHRYFKALKLAGVYAFIDGMAEISEDHLYAAMRLAEDSGRSFEEVLNQDKSHIRLAKYIAAAGSELTHSELVEELPFYKGSSAQKADLLTLATSWGYKNQIIIKKNSVSGIEFITGETLQATDLNAIPIAVSNDVVLNFQPLAQPFDRLYRLAQRDDLHWTVHHFKDNYRSDEHVIPGFNLVVLDVDSGVTLDEVRALMKDYRCLLYTTKRHTPTAHRFRLIIPTNYTLKLDSDDYKEFMTNIYEWIPFPVDTGTVDRARKWLTFNGHYEYIDGEKLIDVMEFIPKTTRNDERKKIVLDTQSLSNLERWFINNTSSGNRSNQLIKYGLMLVDTGGDFNSIRDAVLVLNNKLADGLTEREIDTTILVTVSKAITNKGIV